jgi:long-subunit fatty acid transport protein
MKRVTLALALAALSVPAAAGATQTNSQHASTAKVHASHVKSHVKIYGTVTAITPSAVTVANAAKSKTFARGMVSLAGIRVGSGVEAEGAVRKGVLRLSSIHLDDRAARIAAPAQPGVTQPGDDRGGLTPGATKPSDDPAGDDRGGLTAGTTKPSDDLPGDDHGSHSGLDDGPNHS